MKKLTILQRVLAGGAAVLALFCTVGVLSAAFDPSDTASTSSIGENLPSHSPPLLMGGITASPTSQAPRPVAAATPTTAKPLIAPPPAASPKPKPKPIASKTHKPVVTPKPTHKSSPKPTHKPTPPPDRQGVHPGAYCSPRGAIGYTDKGTRMQCKPSATDSRNRWRQA